MAVLVLDFDCQVASFYNNNNNKHRQKLIKTLLTILKGLISSLPVPAFLSPACTGHSEGGDGAVLCNGHSGGMSLLL